MEKQRNPEGMLEFWTDLRRIFPDELTALRMMMRWYRRKRWTHQGIEKLHNLFPECLRDLEQAEKAVVGFAELRAFDEIDALMPSIMEHHPTARAIRMRYIKVLNQQSRFLDARDIAEQITDADKMGPSSQALLDTVARRASKMSLLFDNNAASVFPQIIGQLRPRQPVEGSSGLGPVVFFSGQLGTGGAERQLTRLAAALQERYQSGRLAGGIALTGPVHVCVKHAAPESGGDFFLPILRQARVATDILCDMPIVPLSALRDVPAGVLNLLELMPEDIFEQTCKLIPYFRKVRPSVAYLWQDGGVLAAATAALIAGVPRVVTSFRGLPPNQRPHRQRPELGPLYRSIATLPSVTFSANAQSSATAYEDWLGLPEGSVEVLPNAIPPVLPDGDAEDHAWWDHVLKASPQCDQTVVGVFRFDENKRPIDWVDVAARLCKENNRLRFVMVGTGYKFAETQSHIVSLGLADRIFLAGLRENVGFYLHRADLMMHLARMEGLPNVLIEAQLAGLPVLATPAGGTAEVMTHLVTGRLLPSAETLDLDAVAGVAADMLGDPVSLKRMGEAAFKQAAPRFLLDEVVDRTVALLATPKKETPCAQR